MKKVISSLVDGLEKMIKAPTKLFSDFSSIVTGLMCLPIFFDVIIRFTTGKSIPGIIEITEFMLVLILFGSLSDIQLKREHIDIDILTSKLSDVLKAFLETLVYLILSIMFAVVSWQTVLTAISKTNEVSPALGLPVYVFVGFSAFGTSILTLCFVRDYLNAVLNLIKREKTGWVLLSIILTGALFIGAPMAKQLLPGLSGLSLGAIGMLLLLMLMFIKMPVGFAMTLVGFLGMWAMTGRSMAPLRLVGAVPYSEAASFLMAVVPMFVLMGGLAVHSGLSKDLFDAAYKWLGRFPGGLAISALAGCSVFAAVCGDSLSTSVTIGSIALPEMKKKGYRPGLATGCIAAGGTLGILIPPSLGFIFYAIVTEESVGKLFTAGILPGVLLTLLFMAYVYIRATLDPESAPRGETFPMPQRFASLIGVLPMLCLFGLILGGILTGIFSPTEGGAVGSVGLFIFAFIRRRMDLPALWKALKETATISTKIMVVVIGVGVLGSFLASSRLPFHLAQLVIGLEVNRYIILAAIVVLYLILGCLMNVIPIILLTLPAIFPTVLSLGFDPIWFGVITVLLMEMGQITPPVGMIVFAIASIEKDVPLAIIFKGIFPFVICMIICVVLLTVFPDIALVLPRLFFK